MPLIVLAGSILLLLLLIARFKVSAFLALLIASFAVGLASGMSADRTLHSILKGVGDTTASVALILVFGAILGKLIEESGASHTISYAFTRVFGMPRLWLSVLITGFIVGLPMMYNAGFLVLIPLVYTLSATTGVPLLNLGIPMCAALAATHGFLPPHPAPTSIALMYGADVNRTLLYGLILTVPAMLLAGPVLARFFRNLKNTPPPELYREREFRSEALPGLSTSLFTTMLPVLLMLAGAVAEMTARPESAILPVTRFLSDANVALFLAAMAAFYTLGVRMGRTMEAVMKNAGEAVASVSMVLLIIASGGAFKQVLMDCGTSAAIEKLASGVHGSPILLAWGTAALLRLAVGSATVAGITAAGILAPLVAHAGVPPELLVLATAAGSLMFSHFNDTAFWMFKEYFNASIRQTFAIWTVIESIVAVAGLAGVLLLQFVVRK
jgi:gluconate transporter